MGRILEFLFDRFAHRLLDRYVREDVRGVLAATVVLCWVGRWVAVRVSRITSPDWTPDPEPEPEPGPDGSFLNLRHKLSDRW